MKIAAFNVQRLGMDKVRKSVVQEKLIQIVSRYSVVVMLEVVDQTGEAIKVFLQELNKSGPHLYGMRSSQCLGRSTYREKFVFFFRKDEVRLINFHQYKETAEDTFAREPFIVQLKCLNTDGRYLSKKKKESISIFSPDYHWLINDEVDTTTSNSTDHTYDRIVVFGDDMYAAVVPRSAQAFNFQKEYHLSDANTKAISDHYPVEVVLRRN